MQDLKGFNTNEFYSRFFVETALDKHVGHIDQDALKSLMGLGQNFFSRFHKTHKSTMKKELMSHREWFHGEIISKLGFSNLEAEFYKTDKNKGIPIRGKVPLVDKEELWIIEGGFGTTVRDLAALDDIPSCDYLNMFGDDHNLTIDKSNSYSKIFDEILSNDSKCSWIIYLAGERMYLLEREKWLTKATYIEVEWEEIFGNKDHKVFKALMGLFGHGAFKVENGEIAHNLLAETAHREAHGVTKSLKFAVRDALELLMNEVLSFYRTNPDSKGFKELEQELSKDELAKELSSQGLRYLYRLLFLFFVESRGREAEILPVKSKGYSLGYSLENLRNLELKKVTGHGSGNYIQQTLEKTFDIMFFGIELKETDHSKELYCAGFECPQIGTMLFDRSKTPLIANATLKDTVMQKVIAKLSLSDNGKGKKSKISRISYANLGLNQLGAVYEGLLDLRPVIVESDCFTVNLTDGEFLIPVADKAKYKISNFQIDHITNKPLLHKKGDFVFSTRGYERKYSASFYTDESLTKCLVKQCLDEYFQKYDGKPNAKDIEDMKILEPAMGSGAFLNETANQLSVYYADAMIKDGKDKTILNELNSKLDIESQLKDLPRKELLDRAKEFIMRNCLYGVDLNPMATELAKVSLWLNCVHKNGRFTFHDFKIRRGNSLVGAFIRQNSKTVGKAIHHFLVPQPEMIDIYINACELRESKRSFFDKKQIEKFEKIKRSYATPEKYEKKLSNLAASINSLYKEHSKKREAFRKIIQNSNESSTEIEKQYTEYVKNNSEYNKIRLAMDYWCTLWFWNPTLIKDIPDLETYITNIEEIISKGEIKPSQKAAIQSVIQNNPFFHYDLEFPEVFKKGGFDLVLGNPPWAELSWSDLDFFTDIAPEFSVNKIRVKKQTSIFEKLLSPKKTKTRYQEGIIAIKGIKAYLTDSKLYPFSDHSKTNTYKYFWQRSHVLCNDSGTYGLIKPNGILTDEGLEDLRPTYFKELKKLYRFRNEKKLFDVGNNIFYVLAIFSKMKKELSFELIDELYHPITIERCHRASRHDDYPRAKTKDGEFNLAGHPDRIVKVSEEALKDLCRLEKKEEQKFLTVSLPRIFGILEWNILKKTIESKYHLGDQVINWTEMFNETNAVKKDLIERWDKLHKKSSTAVLTGPNIFVGNPFYKQPNLGCENHRDFSSVKLEEISPDFYPASKYRLTKKGLSSAKYNSEHTSFFRIACRKFVDTTGIRTFSSVIIPPDVSHINAITTISFGDNIKNAFNAGVASSIIFDFYSRSLTNGNLGKSFWDLLPSLHIEKELENEILFRSLRLNCLSSHYSELWKECFLSSMKKSIEYPKFKSSTSPSKLTSKWSFNSAIRNSNEREQVLCEIDSLVAIAMGISLEDLLRLYRSQFSVLQKKLGDMLGQNDDNSYPRAEIMSGCYEMFLDFFGVTQKQVLNGYFQKKNQTAKKAA